MKGKSTKSALLMSFTSLLLCFAMLIGCTFAWFTDSVTSGVNKIQAGNLDIEVEYSKPGGNGSWNNLQGSESLFSSDKWEPGHTEVVYLKVKNAGTLALKYDLKVSPVSESGGINVAGVPFKLSDHIKFGTTAPSAAPTAYTREEARTAIGDGVGVNSGMMRSNAKMLPNAVDYITLVVYMPTEVGNEANYKTGTAAPFINLGITVLATQVDQEVDSFDKEYDAGLTNDTAVVYNFFPLVTQVAQLKKSASASTAEPGGDNDPQVNAQDGKITITSAATVGEGEGAPVAASVTFGNNAVNFGDATTATVTLDVKKVNEPTANIAVADTQEKVAFDVKVEISGANFAKNTSDNTKFAAPMEVAMFIGKGKTNLKLYHGTTQMKTTVDNGYVAGAADTFTYNSTDGVVTMYVDHFSEFTAVYDEPVAAIGTTAYYSLESAIAAVETSGEVALLKDMTLTEAIVIPDGKTITFNGNGKTVTVDAASGKAAFGNEAVSTEGLKADANLTVKNTNFVSSAERQNYAVITGSGFCGEVNLVNCSFKDMHTAVLMNSNGTDTAANLSITNCAYSNTSWGYSVDTVTGTAKVDVIFNGNSGIDGKELEVFGDTVAIIGIQQYKTLKDAIDAAQAGDTVVLVKDVTVNMPDKGVGYEGTGAIDIKKSLTIDGDGHVISVGSGFDLFNNSADWKYGLGMYHMFSITDDYTQPNQNVNVKINDLTIVDSNTEDDSKIRAGINICLNTSQPENTVSVDLNNVTVQNASIYGVIVNNAKATISGLTTSGCNKGGINVDKAKADAKIIDANLTEPTALNAEGGKTVIEGGTYTNVAGATGTLTITGGTFSADPRDYVAEGFAAKQNNSKKWVVAEVVAATMDGVKYPTLAKAIKAYNDATEQKAYTIEIQDGRYAEPQIEIEQKPTQGGKTLTIQPADGAKVTLKSPGNNKGVFLINGNGNFNNGGGAITIKGIDFDVTNKGYAVWFGGNSTPVNIRYAHSVTLDSCTAIGNAKDEECGVIICDGQTGAAASNVLIKDCRFENVGYVANNHFTNNLPEGLKITGTTAINVKAFVNNANANNILIQNCEVSSWNDYIVRASGSYQDGSITVENSSFTSTYDGDAEAGIFVKKGAGQPVINITNCTTVKTSEKVYDVFGNGNTSDITVNYKATTESEPVAHTLTPNGKFNFSE